MKQYGNCLVTLKENENHNKIYGGLTGIQYGDRGDIKTEFKLSLKTQ